MKKNLLTLGVLALSLSANAQVFYAGDQSQVFVSSKALVYSGGDWKVNSNKEKTVENRGNILIEGNYKKGQLSGADTAQDGKEFVNVYTGANDYGQVKLLNTTGASDARMTVERPALSSNYYGASAGVSFPYKDGVSYLMKAFGLGENTFKGNCQINQECADRYKATLTKWNNKYTHFDAVPSAESFQPGDRYNINLREADMQAVMTNTITYKGTPDGRAYSRVVTDRAIFGKTPDEFRNVAYNDWKNLKNPYNETYKSYLGDYNSISKMYGKNILRFGNPYTSNLDLSSVDGDSAWVQFLVNSSKYTIKTAHNFLFRNFSVEKVMPDFDYEWGKVDGSTEGNNKYFTATYDGTRWTGSAEALLIRPFEVFQLNFPITNQRNLGNTTIVNLQVDFSDKHKTFDYVPSAKNESGSVLQSPSFKANNSPEGIILANSFKPSNVQNTDFYQLEIVLTKDNKVHASPVYIVGASNYNESGSNSSSTEKVFVYGSKNGEVVYNSQKRFNEFNIDNYIGKPLGLGLNELDNGDTYQLRFALYEGSIFNKVQALKGGVFYIKDKTTNKVTLVNPNDPITFVAEDNVNKRFEFYWKEVPQGETVGTLSTENMIKNQSTIVFRDGKQSKVRFENIANTAKVEVYSMAGTLVSSQENIPTNADYTLKLAIEGTYVIKVSYQNGVIRILKTINH